VFKDSYTDEGKCCLNTFSLDGNADRQWLLLKAVPQSDATTLSLEVTF
jgi:hypothetical protein